jgi:hypothetical protein
MSLLSNACPIPAIYGQHKAPQKSTRKCSRPHHTHRARKLEFLPGSSYRASGGLLAGEPGGRAGGRAGGPVHYALYEPGGVL